MQGRKRVGLSRCIGICQRSESLVWDRPDRSGEVKCGVRSWVSHCLDRRASSKPERIRLAPVSLGCERYGDGRSGFAG